MRWRQILWKVSVVTVLILVLGLGTGGVAAERQEGAEPTIQLTVQGDKVSAKIERASLGDVLAELARQADLTVYITSSDAKQTVSAKFEALPLTEGIQRLLQDKSYALITAPTLSAEGKPSGQRVAKIRVLSQGEAYTTIKGRQETTPTESPSPPESPDKALAELKRDALEASDTTTRLEALKKLSALRGQVEDGALAAIVVPALRDTAPEVRGRALRLLPRVMLAEEGGMNHLAEMAQKDASPQLRAAALGYLAVIPDAAVQGHLQQALQDPDQMVRDKAQRLLSQLQSTQAETGDDQAQPKASPPAQSQKQ